ncbi:hypothetical protein Acr_00g0078000 [Actinidia rufa]|uniref:HAT C-terminal dimerisation domain-containing protein n=1 Tax=Actinidia rufa TaxID=165716 RepID=A0A7J0DTF1_9ERIC|nr:hypothetical protein Acr_00g0078000 [Actinidia rufa]
MDANAINHGQGTAQAASKDITETQVTDLNTAQAKVTGKRCRKNNKAARRALAEMIVIDELSFRWNSTYLMLEAACKFESAFERMEEDDTNFKYHYLDYDIGGDEMTGISGETIVNEMTSKVNNCLIRLYEFYASQDSVTVEVPSASEASKLEVDDDCDDPHALIAFQFSSYLEEEEYSSVCKNEVEKYLGDYCEGAKDVMFDILAWWKANSSKYPALFQLARDVLAMPISTVASESTFSTGGRILDPFRSSLSPMMVEVLVCAQNWLRSSLPISIRKAMDKVEEFEKQCEKENQVDLEAEC